MIAITSNDYILNRKILISISHNSFFFFFNETLSHNTEKGHGVTRSQKRFIGLKQAPLSLMFSTYTFIRN